MKNGGTGMGVDKVIEARYRPSCLGKLRPTLGSNYEHGVYIIVMQVGPSSCRGKPNYATVSF